MNVASFKKYLTRAWSYSKWIPKTCFSRDRFCSRKNDVPIDPYFQRDNNNNNKNIQNRLNNS